MNHTSVTPPGAVALGTSAPRHLHASSALFTTLFDDLHEFSELEARIEALPNERSRGAAFEVFAEAWLATQRLSQARNIWPADSVPTEIQSQLRLPLKDMGVDGVFDTALGEYVCYQAKFRSGRPSLTWSEIATFFGLADFATERLLFTNCDDVSEIAEQRRDVVFIRGSDLDGLTPDDFRAIKQWIAGAAVAIPKKSPKPHQTKAIKNILHAFETKSRATALMACGTGKTLVGLWTAERLHAQSILVLVPSLALVRQVLHEWLHETNFPEIEYLCVCSDESVDRGNDELLVRPSDVDFRVTTQPSAVRQFLFRESTAVKVIFSTYQSSAVVAEAAKDLPPFDFGVFDEAHKTAGREGAKFGVALADERIRISRRLFMTATPRHYDVGIRDKSGDAKLVYSMDVREVYGPVVYRISFSEAAKLRVISDYKVVVSFVTSEEVTEELRRRGIVLVKGQEIKAAQVANQIALRSAVERNAVRKIFTFHSRIAAAESFTSARPEGIREHLPEFKCFFVKGVMPAAYREKLLREFAAADQAIMSNARCLTEGVDLPAVDMVGFLSPRRSLVDIVQATGRAMRRAPGKDFGYVLVPLYVEQTRGETVEEAVARSKFDEVWRVLQSLKEHDDLLAQIISDMRMERGQTGGYDDSRFRERVEVLGPTISLENLRRFITSACIDALGESWFERYGELVAYKQRFGHCDVPKRSVGKEKKLANWVVQQRVSRNAGTLSRDKIDLLDRLGFKWHPGGHRWRENYLLLREYRDRFGNCRVPQNWKENKVLARWVQEQKMRRKRNQLSTERVQLLDEIGFDWIGDVFSWEQRFAQLCEFKRRFGNTRVHARWPENPKLGGWVVAQRCKRRRGKLCREHKQKLTSIGFEWEVEGSPESWERMFNDLVNFKMVEGHLKVPATAEHATLCRWIKRQRRRYKLRCLPEDCLKRLNEIGFEWTPAQPSASSFWNDMLGRLSKHRQATGSVAFHHGDRAPPSLKRWCTEQRKLRIQGQLTTQQIAQLDVLGFRWNPRRGPDIPTDSRACRCSREKSWKNNLNNLLDYFKIHGNYNVPQNWTANRELGRWVLSQRSAKRQGSLSSEHERRLAAIGFNWRVRSSSWERMYDRMHAYMTSAAASKVRLRMPPTLRSWAVTQRLNRKRGTLDAMRIAKLCDIGFEWEPHRTRWENLFSQLVLFREKHKHCRVPATWPENPQLAHWVAVQRARHKAGKLAVWRIEALDQLDFTWKREISVLNGDSNLGLPRARSLDWPEMFNQLRKFRALNGHFAIPRRLREERRLVDWVVNQRILRRRRLLDPACENQLDEIGFDWNPSTNRWEQMFQQLVEFKKEHGHTNVPQHSGKYAQLAHWVRNQRAAKRYNRPIISERGKRLDSIGFKWRLMDPNSWESMFERLVEFKKVYGHCNVPQHWKQNKQLGKWVNTQRTAYKRNKIPAEKEKQLNEIGFAWRLARTNKCLVPLGSQLRVHVQGFWRRPLRLRPHIRRTFSVAGRAGST